ncbi:MAG TPA: MATE family efflux transporter [Steroidobacteraceae bacterium]|nr:MATE family efflux transporter [Steroidobacteraceae bacterium]
MDAAPDTLSAAPGELPARRIDAAGRAHVDLPAVLALALPLIANSAVQTVLNLTDLWFIGHISTTALAAVGSVNWLVIAVVITLGGAGVAVQTTVAQAFGSGRRARAARSAWTGLWGTLCVAPVFILVGLGGHLMLRPFSLPPAVEQAAAAFWAVRVGGAPFGVAVWGFLGFFNGISRPRTTVLITVMVTAANMLLNDLFIFHLGFGVTGSAWASTCAQFLALIFALGIFVSARYRREYRSHLTWRPKAPVLWRQFLLGLPMGLMGASDLIGVSLFQLMQVRLGEAAGAATQLVMAGTAIAWLPGVGVAQAGTTLVGQSIGAGDRRWAMHVGTYVIGCVALLMGGIGLVLALAAPWVLPLLVNAGDAATPEVLRDATRMMWMAAAYQCFDGLNIGSSFGLRGAGDAVVPGALVLLLSWFVFVPLAHMLTFTPGQGFIGFLPQFGFGAVGGWAAVVVYTLLLGAMLFTRWRMGVWQRIRI